MSSFFNELKQRKVYRVAVGYAIVAWLVVQISATVMPAYHAPEWILPLFITAVALGFPVALVLAWVFDIKEGAIKKAPTVATLSGANKRRVWLLAVVGLIIARFQSVFTGCGIRGAKLFYNQRLRQRQQSSKKALPCCRLRI